MEKRICVSLEDDIEKKLREKQSKLIRKNHSSTSVSYTINQVLREKPEILDLFIKKASAS